MIFPTSLNCTVSNNLNLTGDTIKNELQHHFISATLEKRRTEVVFQQMLLFRRTRSFR